MKQVLLVHSLNILLKDLFCVGVSPACIHHTCIGCQGTPEEGLRSPGTGVLSGSGCQLSYGCWEPNLDLLQEHG